jgi:hypothetical protein
MHLAGGEGVVVDRGPLREDGTYGTLPLDGSFYPRAVVALDAAYGTCGARDAE